jgi:hypothetical protein
MKKEDKSSASSKRAAEILKDKGKLLANVMSSMGDGLSIQDLDMKIVFQNKFMIDHFGKHVGEYCYKVYEKRETVCEGCPIQMAYKDGNTHKALRVGQTAEGPFRFENVASVLKDDEEQIIAGMELVMIVEDKEKAIDELKKKTQQIEEINKKAIEKELKMVELKKIIKELEEKL